MKSVDVRDQLKKLIDINPLSQNEIAKKLGVSSGYISKFINKKQEIAFWMVYELVCFLDSENEQELMKGFIDIIKRNENIRASLEYSHSKNYRELTDILIQRCSLDSNQENEEWGFIYKWQLQSKRMVYYDEESYLKNLKALTPKTLEMKTLLMILEMYCHFFKKRYELAAYYVRNINDLILNIQDPFITKSFKCRLNEASAYIFLKKDNDILNARKIADELIEENLGPNYLITGYFVKGLSFFLESYEMASQCFEKVIEISKKIGRNSTFEETCEQLGLLQIFWEKPLNTEKNSRFVRALASLKKIDQFSRESKYVPLILLFEGKRKQNKEKLLLAMHYFYTQKDNFRASIPRYLLERLGIQFNNNEGGEYV
ncbi:AimR family lysis-lysogeny pheromone receptor [Bacillus safensis]